MFKYLILAFLLVFIFTFLLSSTKLRTILFWVSLMLFFDPGGFFAGYMGGDIFWRIKYYDVFFGLMLLIYLIKGENRKLSWQSSSFLNIIKYLLFISLYFFIIFGILVPLYMGYSELPFFLQKNRQYFYALPLFIMTYRYSLTSIQVFYKVLIIFSAIILISYMLTLLTPIKIVPVYTLNRYGEGNRITMISYGLIDWVLPMGMIILLLGKRSKLPLRHILMLVFLLMFITIILTLTRREFLRIVFMIVVIPFLLSKINKSLFINKYVKFIFPALAVILLLIIIFPKYTDLSVRLLNDSFHLVVTGEDTQGVEDYRLTGTGDLEIVKDIIAENLLFGIGYYPAQWSDVVEMKNSGDKLGFALDASSEVPVYGALMRLGIFGLILPFLLYLFIYRIWLKAYRSLRINYQRFIDYPVELLMLITLLYFLLTKVTIEVYSLFGEFYSPYDITSFVVLLGIWLGIFNRFKMILVLSKSNTHNVTL